MNCNEIGSFLSAICDGESAPRAAAQHVVSCKRCMDELRTFSEIGVQLRLAASLQPESTPAPIAWPKVKSKGRSRFGFLFGQIAIPRLALGLILAALLIVSATLSVVRAQAPALWVGFGFATKPGELRISNIARRGEKIDFTTFAMESSVIPNGDRKKLVAIGVHLEPKEISNDGVTLKLNTRLYRLPNGMNGGEGSRITRQARRELASGGEVIHYVPGRVVQAPVEGGVLLYFKGFVQDHQPKVAWGLPLELSSNELAIRSPILVEGNDLLFESGGSGFVDDRDGGVTLLAGSKGTYTFALRPFSGAVRGEAIWGQLEFQLNEKRYRLVAAAPLTGGDQPRPVWVSFDPAPAVVTQGIGSKKLP